MKKYKTVVIDTVVLRLSDPIYDLFKKDREFTAEDVQQELKGKGISLNIATIYRNLRRILKYGDIIKVKNKFKKARISFFTILLFLVILLTVIFIGCMSRWKIL